MRPREAFAAEESPRTRSAIVQKEKRSIEESSPCVTASAPPAKYPRFVGTASHAFCGSTDVFDQSETARPSTPSTPGKKACEVTPSDCRKRTSHPKAWQAPQNTAATASTTTRGIRTAITSNSHAIFFVCSTACSSCASLNDTPRFATRAVITERQSVLVLMSSISGRERPHEIATGRTHVGFAAIDAKVRT